MASKQPDDSAASFTLVSRAPADRTVASSVREWESFSLASDSVFESPVVGESYVLTFGPGDPSE
jgi:hypothetical protein